MASFCPLRDTVGETRKRGALAARRPLQPNDQNDNADDRRGGPDLDGTVRVKQAEHGRTLYALFGVSAGQRVGRGLCCR
jgi:hypothetical protein